MTTTRINAEYLQDNEYTDLISAYFDEFIETGNSTDQWVEYRVSGRGVPDNVDVLMVVEVGSVYVDEDPLTEKMTYKGQDVVVRWI